MMGALLKQAFIGTVFLLCLYFVQAQEDPRGFIKGKVKTQEDVLEFVTVALGSQTAITDRSGEFYIAAKPGMYTLSISHGGYEAITRQVAITAGETVGMEVVLTRKDMMHEVTVLGSRSHIPRNNMNTAMPVDVITAKELSRSSFDLTQQLSSFIPSFNSTPQTIGSNAIINPATLRGMGPDETLVLINGHRRHTTANIFLQYSMGYGTVCTDLNTIPSAAIENIEVLRDGAASQYGSDAIAGAINLQLKRTTGKTSVQLQTGQCYKGDDGSIALDINHGFLLPKNGFLNVTFYGRFNNYTQRNGRYDSTIYYNIPGGASPSEIENIKQLDNQKAADRGFDRFNFRKIGLPKILNTGVVLNGEYPLTLNTKLYCTGTFNYRFAEDRSSSIYRYPKDTTTVITALYPDGFLPLVVINIVDASFTTGMEGKSNNDWLWHLSCTYGGNSIATSVLNTNNASQYALGKDAQTQFYTGSMAFTQNTNTLNFTRDFAKYVQHIKSLTVSLGGELRVEHYQITEGEKSSWENYDPSSGRTGGSQGVPGNNPENAVSKNRYVNAAYAEMEIEKNEKLLFNFSGRYEHYSDYGGNLAGKLAMRYRFSDYLLLRGSIGNGFRAPALQQRYFSAINQVGGRNVDGLIVTGTYRNDSQIAQAFGISQLQAEKSVNLNGGITSKISEHINFTIDWYWTQLTNRIILTGIIPGSLQLVRTILDSLHRKDIQSVRFFTNAVNTRTSGVDLVATGTWLIKTSVLEILLSANFNKTKIFGSIQNPQHLPNNPMYKDILVNPEERGRIELAQPSDKIIASARYQAGKWEFFVRSIHFGRAAHIFNGTDINARFRDEYFSPKVLSGCNIGYSLQKGIVIKIGVANLFNVYPDKLKNRKNTQGGLLIYDPNGTQIGYNGGYYFMNLKLDL